MVGNAGTHDRARVVVVVRGMCVAILHGGWAAPVYGAHGSAHATQEHDPGYIDHPRFRG